MSKSHILNVRRTQSDQIIQNLARQLKKIKYPIQAISPAQQLQKKIQTFHDQKLDKQIKQKVIIQRQLNAYRQVRGDGNCFFRAFAFSYICSIKDVSNVEQVFFLLDQIDLTICHEKSIPKQFKPYYNNINLKNVLKTTWKVEYDFHFLISDKNPKRTISRVFRQNPYIDFIVVLYFRSACLAGFQKYSSQLKSFMKGTQQQEIRTYGQESEGVILDICSRFLKTNIEVYQIRKNELKHYYYKPLTNSISKAYLLFYQNHYDLLQTNKYIQDQKKDLKTEQEDYFQEKNQNMINGSCLQCGDVGKVYQQNGLCFKCYQLSLNNFQDFQKDKMKTGICNQCGKKKDISLKFGLCRQCIDFQNNYQQRQKQSMVKSFAKNQNQQETTYTIGVCVNCRYREKIQRQTKLCAQCKRMQTNILLQSQKRAQIKKKICPDCLQSQQSQLHLAKCKNKLTKAVFQSKMQGQIKQQQNQHSFAKSSCKNCRKLVLDKVLDLGICENCWDQMKNQSKKNNKQQFCKKCDRSSKFYVLKEGFCPYCRASSRIF